MEKDIPSRQGKNKDFIDNQWKPGQSGNPGGRPKNTLTELLREYLDANNGAERSNIIKTLLDIAKTKGQRGQVQSLKEIFDRIDGKVPDTHIIEGDVPVSIIYKQVGDAIKQGEE